MDSPLASIFPGENNIPAPFQLLEFIEQREYLVNGEMRVWQGNLNPV
jgi:glyceraldehyde-3-phosphate dehydrogenase (NADP+)